MGPVFHLKNYSYLLHSRLQKLTGLKPLKGLLSSMSNSRSECELLISNENYMKKLSESKLIRVQECNLDDLSVFAGSLLKQGHVIALPTDTIYGIAALVQNKAAVEKIYNIKGRQCEKPIAICVSSIEDVYRWGEVTVSESLLEKLLPGPVTVCFKRKPELNKEFNPGAPLVGIRVPDSEFIRQICIQTNQVPLALTSANVSRMNRFQQFPFVISSATSTLCVDEFQSLFPLLSAVFDGGKLGETSEARLGSTIVDLSVPGSFKITRDGSAKSETLKTLRSFGLQEYF